MLSETSSEIVKGINSQESLSKSSKKFINRNEMYKINLRTSTMKSQLAKRADASVLEFYTIHESQESTKTWKGLTRSIKSMKRVLKIDITDQYNRSLIFDQSLRYFCEDLKRSSSLRSINLSFQSCGNLTDVGLNNLGESLKRLSSLRSINLNFPNCEKITDYGLKKFEKGLRRLSSLRSINLNFQCCNNITDHGLNNLKEGLKRLSSLKSINLDLR